MDGRTHPPERIETADKRESDGATEGPTDGETVTNESKEEIFEPS